MFLFSRYPYTFELDISDPFQSNGAKALSSFSEWVNDL